MQMFIIITMTTTGVAKTIIHCIDAISRTNETHLLRNELTIRIS